MKIRRKKFIMIFLLLKINTQGFDRGKKNSLKPKYSFDPKDKNAIHSKPSFGNIQ